jgi:hypothetical protein
VREHLVPHRRKLLVFVVLSCADLILTWALLHRDSTCVYEANPVAGWWLDRFGILGLGAFKGATLLVALGAILLLIGRQPHLAGRVLWFGCAAVGGVVLYSCTLGGYLEAALDERPDLRDPFPGLLSDNYLRLRGRVIADLLERRCTLSGAVADLEPAIQVEDPNALEALAERYPSLSTDELVAVSLIEDTLARLNTEPEQSRRLLGELQQEYRSAFHHEPPVDLWTPAELPGPSSIQ